MNSTTNMEIIANDVAQNIIENLESPFYSDIEYRLKPYYKSNVSKRHLLFSMVCDKVKSKGIKIWS